MKHVLALLFVPLTAVPLLAAPAQQPRAGSQPIEPYKVIANIYYVGSQDVSSHIIVTPQGIVLMDTGTTDMTPMIRSGIEKLGFKPSDVKIILSSHAHWDHVEGHAAMKALTGASIMALGDDATAIAAGVDDSALGGAGWTAAKVDRVLKDGDTVTLGDVTLTAHHTPGHTKGCTTWTTTVKDGSQSYAVVFVGGTSINEGVRLLGNARHPGIVEDYARTFRVLKGLQPDVFLAQHGRLYNMEDKRARLKAATGNPFIDREGYRRFVSEQETAYLKQLAQEHSAQAASRKRFVGTWRLISIEGGANTGNRGGKPTGVIYYDATGHMAAQIQPDRERPRYTGTPTPEQAYERMRGYTAYFGTYTIDEKAGTVTHRRQGMLDPGAVDFVRKFEFIAGDRLVLTPVPAANAAATATPARLTWERIK